MSTVHPPEAWFPGYDDLDRAARESLLAHARECAECRDRLVAADPTRVFAFLAFDELPEPSLARVSDAVRRLIEAPAAAEPPPPRRVAWASIAASLLLAAALSGLVLQRPRVVVPPPAAAPVQAARALPAGTDPLPEAIELLSPAGADVYDLTVGDAQVVMIFDADLDI